MPVDRKAVNWGPGAHYAVAVLVTAVALFVRYLMTPEWGLSLPFITLYPAIAFSAWLGGFGPGVLTTTLGALAVAYFWPDHFAGSSAAGDALALSLFMCVGVFVSSLTWALRQARTRAELTADDLRRAREEAERANRAKDEFLAVVAHELKQPLNAMLPAVALMRHRLSPESLAAANRTLDLLNRQIAHLQHVVGDLLDASRVVRGQVTLQPHGVDALQIMRDAIDVVRPRAEERHQRIHVDLPATGAPLNADPVRLQQVFLNVLSNATAYTPPEGGFACRPTWTIRVSCFVFATAARVSPQTTCRAFSACSRGQEAAAKEVSESGWRLRAASWSCTAGPSRRRAMDRAAAASSESAFPRIT